MKRSLAVLAVLAMLPARADFRYSDTQLQLYMPGAPWAFTMPRGDWRLVQEQRKPDGSGLYYFMVNDKGSELSVYLDRTSECASPASCLQLWRSRSLPGMQGARVVNEGEHNGFRTVTYEQRGVRVGDRTVAQTNVSAHGYRDGHWIDFRVSAAGPTPPDSTPLLAIVDKLSFAPPVLEGRRRYPIGPNLAELDVPAAWRDEVAPGRQQSIRFTAASGRDFMVLASFILTPEEKAPPGTPERAQANVRRAADAARERAVEKSIDVMPLRGESAQGYYYKATVRTPEKGGFGHVAQGEVKAANVTVTFTILSNEGEEAAVQQALEMVKSLRVR
jgi:hypothetical protein